MSSRQCQGCGKPIDSNARVCPHCGYANQSNSASLRKSALGLLFVSPICMCIVIALLVTSDSFYGAVVGAVLAGIVAICAMIAFFVLLYDISKNAESIALSLRNQSRSQKAQQAKSSEEELPAV